MKLKEIDRTVHVAWSPAKADGQKANSNYFMAGTAAQQLDASFRFVISSRKILFRWKTMLFFLVRIHN